MFQVKHAFSEMISRGWRLEEKTLKKIKTIARIFISMISHIGPIRTSFLLLYPFSYFVWPLMSCLCCIISLCSGRHALKAKLVEVNAVDMFLLVGLFMEFRLSSINSRF